LCIKIIFVNYIIEFFLEKKSSKMLNNEGEPPGDSSDEPSAEPSGHPTGQQSGETSDEPAGEPSDDNTIQEDKYRYTIDELLIDLKKKKKMN
jgi:hypothetical protein